MPRLIYPCCIYFLCLSSLRAEEKAGPSAKTVEQIAETARKSVVVITRQPAATASAQGLGTGFVVAADGLIATNLHVIGEGRPITVRDWPTASSYEVTAVHASDRTLDLAVIRIDAKDLTPLELGDSDDAQGRPGGRRAGQPARPGAQRRRPACVSGRREIDGRSMIQLAIPIEPGNSGGPLLDMQGRVHGILTIKSLVTDNLGFAVAGQRAQAAAEEAQPGADGALADHRRPRRRRVAAAVRRPLAAAGRPHPRRGAGQRLRRPLALPVAAAGARAALRGRRHRASSTTRPAPPAWSSTPTAATSITASTPPAASCG